MSNVGHKSVRIVGVPLDLGASRRGTDMGPSALRIAGLGAAIRRLRKGKPRQNEQSEDCSYRGKVSHHRPLAVPT